MKVRDLIYSVMRLAGALASGEAATASEAQDALKSANSMLGLFSLDGLLIHKVTIEEFDLIPGQASYTIGASANFGTSRPTQILNAGLVDQDVEQPIELINNQQWAEVSAKGISSSIPTKLYFEPAFPQAVIYLWPVPSTATKLKLYSLKPLTAFASLDEEITLPPGYEELIKYNLYLRLAPEYGKPVDPDLRNLAIEAKLGVERQGNREILSTTGLTSLIPRAYNIFSGGSN